MNDISRSLTLNYSNIFKIFLLIIISLNSYLIYSAELNLTDQILNLLISFGVFTYYKDTKVKNTKVHKYHSAQLVLSNLILIFCLYRSMWIFNTSDKFIYCLFTLLLLSLIMQHFSLRDLNLHLKPMIISLLFALKEIVYIPLSIALTPISTFFTWFFLNLLGYKAVVKGSEVFYDNGGINITFSCSGSDQLIFCISSILVLSICFPLENKKLLLEQIFYTICFTLLVNIFRLSILTIFEKTANSDGFSMFDYLHGGNGSLVFSLISMIFCCESYKRAFLRI